MSEGFKRDLAERIHRNCLKLCEFYQEQERLAPPPFYCSVDLRDSGFKIVPVDCNLYPAGFNNICPADLESAPRQFRRRLEIEEVRLGVGPVRRILILPEAHTKNAFYIENIEFLAGILSRAGYETVVGWLPGGEVPGPVGLVSNSGKTITAQPIEFKGKRIVAGGGDGGGFEPDLILLNNDFSSGYPPELDTVEQPILPSHWLGWHSRRKIRHFHHYNELAGEFASIIGIDPWIARIDTEAVGGVNFNEELGVRDVADAVGRVLTRTAAEYAARGIRHKPFTFVKNDAGTYGMGIMVAHSSDDLLNLNRRIKNKMSVGKNRQAIESVVVQEGIPTDVRYGTNPAEPVIYLVGTELLGGFLRTNVERGAEENLNAKGMVFRKLCMSDLKTLDELSQLGAEGAPPPPSGFMQEAAAAAAGGPCSTPESVLETVYGTIARLSALAAGRELAERL